VRAGLADAIEDGQMSMQAQGEGLLYSEMRPVEMPMQAERLLHKIAVDIIIGFMEVFHRAHYRCSARDVRR